MSMVQNSLADIPAAVEAGRLVEDEEDTGLAAIPAAVYARYIRAAGGFALFALVLLLFALNVASTVFSTVWLSEWLKEGAKTHVSSTTPLPLTLHHWGMDDLARHGRMRRCRSRQTLGTTRSRMGCPSSCWRRRAA